MENQNLDEYLNEWRKNEEENEEKDTKNRIIHLDFTLV